MKKINNPNKKRILIIDDNIQIHQDFKKVLLISKEKENDLDKLEEALLGKTPDQLDETYLIDYASQGEEGLKMVEESIKSKELYAVAFIDVRMPPGWDGIETISKIWEVYPELQVVICTAYSDYSWDELFNKFGNTDKLLILKKPFDNIEVRQLTYTLSKKWELNRIANLKMSELERNVEKRTKELQLSEEKYRMMIEYSNDMIWTLNTKGNFSYFNKKSEELTGYDIKKGAGESFVPIILEEDLEMVQNVFLDTLAGNSNHYEVRIHDITKTKIITLSVNTAPIIKEGKVVGTVSFGRDITEQKLAENALKQSEKDYRDLFNNATDAIYVQDREGHFLNVNQGAVEMYGYPKEFFIGKTPEFLSAPRKNDMKKIIGFVEDAFNGKPRQYDFWGIRKNGEVFPKIVRSHKGIYLGKEVVVTFAIDITERKKAEEEIKISRERLKMLNQIIRHDLSNDFIVIKSAVRIFKQNPTVKILDEIVKRTEKSLKTIADYKKYESFIESRANLYEIEITELFKDLVAEFPKIKFNIEGECKVFADDALSSTFSNLITNSIKHGNSSQIDIIISSDRNTCKIMFMDNGTGISDKIKDKIFEEGFFFGKTGHTGIGLHIARKTIEHYGGSISVEDNKPKGAAFVIKLRNVIEK